MCFPENACLLHWAIVSVSTSNTQVNLSKPNAKNSSSLKQQERVGVGDFNGGGGLGGGGLTYMVSAQKGPHTNTSYRPLPQSASDRSSMSILENVILNYLELDWFNSSSFRMQKLQLYLSDQCWYSSLWADNMFYSREFSYSVSSIQK